jgi:hypothetical protein
MSEDIQKQNINACIELAERFIKRAKAARPKNYGPEQAGMKRASLDLTRGLADLRIGDTWQGEKRQNRDVRRWL